MSIDTDKARQWLNTTYPDGKKINPQELIDAHFSLHLNAAYVSLDILDELRSIRARMDSDRACGFASPKDTP